MNAEIERLLANMIRIGVIAELDEGAALVKVAAGGLLTDWLPWGTARAGATRTWSAPTVGEQVLLFSPYGDTGQAIVGPSIYQDARPAPAASADQEHTAYPDGSTVDYNSATNTLTVTVAAAGNVVVNCKQATLNTEAATINASDHVRVQSPTSTFTGAVIVQGLLTYQAGMAGSGLSGGAAATITGPVKITGATTLATVTSNGKNIGSNHYHVNSGGSGNGGVPA